MKMIKYLLLALLALPYLASANVITMEWDELLPEAERLAQAQAPDLSHDASMANQQQSTDVNVRDDLNGKTVRLPGFVVPLEGDEHTITEFFLVPYFGACIHVPPPPPNQIIYVNYPKGAPIDDVWGAVWIEGKIKAETKSNDLATVGYTMEGIKVEVYQE
ncbi:DUF3299 domain-containing protein [Motilimonas eburnea]|uniref:DUF3299 domain-containing protein n=1 Tax=Motilimonas eburnea TaxID=1737488 RepID=UPI001E47D85D|nr:DUF3299 domain-containing protein [Motilimonas eburnea]MCE2571003.1 DUF3299 domain-containing protein [Motilimonas eburnea]